MRDTTFFNMVRMARQWQHLGVFLPKKMQVAMQSKTRTMFMQRLQRLRVADVLERNYASTERVHIQQQLEMLDTQPIEVLGLKFRHSLYNAAGVFKGVEGYRLVDDLKAGAFTFGTTTHNPRTGNTKYGVHHPFIALEQSQAAVNFLGLPNQGDSVLSQHQFVYKSPYCPVIVSVMRSPDYHSVNEAMVKLIESLFMYHNNSTIDMIEINESCPNVGASMEALVDRLRFIQDQFLVKRTRHLPVVLKLSNAMDPEGIKNITEHLIRLGFDGVVVGNTVTNYADYMQRISQREQALFEYFTQAFGGGLSGLPLKATSLRHAEVVAEVIERLKPAHEFALIRCGGIYTAQDLIESRSYNISLNQWFTGFIEAFLTHDIQTYVRMYE